MLWKDEDEDEGEGLGMRMGQAAAAVTSTFSALRLPFTPRVYFHHFHFQRSVRCGPGPPPCSRSRFSGRAMHIQLTFQLKSLCKAATKGAPTKRKGKQAKSGQVAS